MLNAVQVTAINSSVPCDCDQRAVVANVISEDLPNKGWIGFLKICSRR